jgi:HEAT repeat protein
MLKTRIYFMLIIALLLGCGVQSFGQTVVPATEEQVDKLVAVLKSDAPIKEKMDACRLLSIVGTKDAIAPLASLLGDEKLSHMARYGLEPIPDPSVDEALREALVKLEGRPLIGVIGSIGVRRDVKAVEPLKEMLMQHDLETQVTSAIVRALGNIGNSEASEILKAALEHAPEENRLPICEGLFRCAENLMSQGRRKQAIAIYDQMRKLDSPHQVRAGALRGAILARGIGGDIPRRPGETTRRYLMRRNDGIALMMEHLRSDDYIMFSAAVQTAQELSGNMVTRALTVELNKLPADNQILVIQTLGKRGDAAACPALFTLAKGGAKPVRIAAIKSLAEIGDDSAVPLLGGLLNDGDSEISQAAQESLASLPVHKADEAVTRMLNSRQASRRLTALELISRRRMTSSVPAVLRAAGDDDQKIRSSALRRVGELGGLTELPALLDLLIKYKSSQDLDAVERALGAICMKADNPQIHATKLINLLSRVQPMQKCALLHVLGIIGGPEALEAVRGEVDNSNESVRGAAVRALCGWKTSDAAPDLLALAKGSRNASQKTASLRGYINLVRDESLSTEEKLEMCRQASELIQRSEEKKLLLGVLGTVPSAEALSMAVTYMNEPLVRNEACFAVVGISEKIVLQNPDEVADAIGKVLDATKNRNVTRRAKQVLNKAK